MQTLYPLFANLVGRTIVVIGGGPVAERKTRALLDSSGSVQLVAPALTPGLRELVTQRAVAWHARRFTETDLDGAWLVIAATADKSLNRAVVAAANRRAIWVNVVDDAALSSFHVPAVVKRSPVQVAISSGGAAPGVTTWVRERLETVLDDSLGPLAALLGRWRTKLKTQFPDLASRRRFVRSIVTGNIGADVRAGRLPRADRRLAEVLAVPSEEPARKGRVALVGAGPGDAGLLTLRALRLLQQADVILHDRLVSNEILALARRDAHTEAVGKRPGDPPGESQARINQRMNDHAGAGRVVVRLKGGDPFIFGRGGEEANYLREHGIDYEIVPGITAAVGCASYAGVPLTHRDHAQSVHFVTAHGVRALDELDWPALAKDGQTLAVYMGVARLDAVAQQLVTHGRSPKTPFALIENGTYSIQRLVTGSLEDLPVMAHDHDIQAPALLIVGEVANFASRLAWFGSRPITANEAQAAA